MDKLRSELNQKFENLQIESHTQQDKLKNNASYIQSQDNQIQALNIQLEREREKSAHLQIDLDT